jgi:hypothetical protein
MKVNSDSTTALRFNRILSGLLTPTVAEFEQKVKPKQGGVMPENLGNE